MTVPDRPWRSQARQQQLPPDDPWKWFVYLLAAGRGFGKTRAGAEWIAEQAATHPNTDWVVVSPTWRDCQRVCFEGPSGIVQAFLPGELWSMNASEQMVRLSNGSTIRGYSADQPDRILNLDHIDGVWIDELAVMSNTLQLWDEYLLPSMSIKSRAFITTTPRGNELLTRLLENREVGPVIHVTGSTWDNASNLSHTAVEELRRRYEGTNIGRQELYGEMLEPAGSGAAYYKTIDEATVEQICRRVVDEMMQQLGEAIAGQRA